MSYRLNVGFTSSHILCYADDGDTIARKALGHYYLASAWSRFCHTPKEEVCQRGDAQVF